MGTQYSIHPIFDTFKRVALIVKHSPHKDQILKTILGGTQHSNLIQYHQDKSISVKTKMDIYKEIIGTFDPSGNFNTKNQPSPQPSSVFGYSKEEGETTGKPLISSADLVAMKLLKNELEGKDQQLKEQEHLIKTLLKDKEELQKQQPKIIQLTVDNVLKGKLEGERFHKQLPLIVKLLSARNAMGFTEFIYIWGAPGSGKTHMSKQIAKCLGVPCFTYPVGPTITEGKLLGFNNIATGGFIPGWLYRAYKDGGLVALDEIDLADAAVLGATNSIENDCYMFGNGEFVERHPDFYLIAFANTQGTGSTKGFTRNVLDAATRDRFTQLKLEYDEELEQIIYGNPAWAKYVQKVRDYVVKSCNESIYITPRATRKGSAYLAAGIPANEVCDITIFKSCSKDMKIAIQKNVGEFKL